MGDLRLYRGRVLTCDLRLYRDSFLMGCLRLDRDYVLMGYLRLYHDSALGLHKDCGLQDFHFCPTFTPTPNPKLYSLNPNPSTLNPINSPESDARRSGPSTRR